MRNKFDGIRNMKRNDDLDTVSKTRYVNANWILQVQKMEHTRVSDFQYFWDTF